MPISKTRPRASASTRLPGSRAATLRERPGRRQRAGDDRLGGVGGKGSAPAPAGDVAAAGPGRDWGRWLALWAAAFAGSLLHVSLLVWVAARVAGGPVTYLVLGLPALILLVVAPKPTLRHGYRWVAVWALTYTSVVSTPTLLICQAWVLRRAWIESGRTLRLRPALTGGRIGSSLPGRDARVAR